MGFWRSALHPVRIVQSALRERAKAKTRSPHWATVRDHWLATNPTCAACGSRVRCQVHHIVPFSNDPSRELDPTNFITLCMSRRHEDHLHIGHGGKFSNYNPNVVVHAIALRKQPERRKELELLAKAMRKD